MKSGSVVAVASLLVSTLPMPAHADKAADVFIDDFACGAFVPDANGGASDNVVIGSVQSVVTSSGFSKITCHFSIPRQSRSTQATGFPCFTLGGLTFDSRVVASAGGQMVLTCIVFSPQNRDR